ncbi:transmembrane protein, putative (macronuclear) [Tetrahymena thermophila SB210]|uniref:Transmembrane protein, putative n=1 Tax=Tetrahymena thermophila (strain SB210) TaxID=312017 RepID=W7X363_TETTS|nr:transmembrane protein, putative [Tetrahymena thermophila SB210]EWS73740.1 transmembrane protein, putative [Tetrahymena thermophila SB210]|eukprot:XP_012653704.1 transmembrane protein, putative [Tetrahymena thermophila SB210]
MVVSLSHTSINKFYCLVFHNLQYIHVMLFFQLYSDFNQNNYIPFSIQSNHLISFIQALTKQIEDNSSKLAEFFHQSSLKGFKSTHFPMKFGIRKIYQLTIFLKKIYFLCVDVLEIQNVSYQMNKKQIIHSEKQKYLQNQQSVWYQGCLITKVFFFPVLINLTITLQGINRKLIKSSIPFLLSLHCNKLRIYLICKNSSPIMNYKLIIRMMPK